MHPLKTGGIPSTNQILLRDIGIRTHCGQKGRLKEGRLAGGNAYGDDVLPGGKTLAVARECMAAGRVEVPSVLAGLCEKKPDPAILSRAPSLLEGRGKC